MLVDFRRHRGLTGNSGQSLALVVHERGLTAHVDTPATDAVGIQIDRPRAGRAIGHHAGGQKIHHLVAGRRVCRMRREAAVSELFTGPEVAISR